MNREQLETVRKMRASGRNKSQISEAMGVDRATVRRWLERGDEILSYCEAQPTGHSPRAMRAELVPKIMAVLDGGEPMIAADIAKICGVSEVRVISSLLCSLERMKEIERVGLRETKTYCATLFGKVGTAHQGASIAPKIVAPRPQYRSALAELMGEPPIGRSALDMREART